MYVPGANLLASKSKVEIPSRLIASSAITARALPSRSYNVIAIRPGSRMPTVKVIDFPDVAFDGFGYGGNRSVFAPFSKFSHRAIAPSLPGPHSHLSVPKIARCESLVFD